MNDCSICILSGGCLLTVRECASTEVPIATEAQLIERLKNNTYPNDKQKIIDCLFREYGVDYAKLVD